MNNIFIFNVLTSNIYEEAFAFGYVKCKLIKSPFSRYPYLGKIIEYDGFINSEYKINEDSIINIKNLKYIKSNKDLKDIFYNIIFEALRYNYLIWTDNAFPDKTNFLNSICSTTKEYIQLYDLSSYINKNIPRYNSLNNTNSLFVNKDNEDLCIRLDLSEKFEDVIFIQDLENNPIVDSIASLSTLIDLLNFKKIDLEIL